MFFQRNGAWECTLYTDPHQGMLPIGVIHNEELCCSADDKLYLQHRSANMLACADAAPIALEDRIKLSKLRVDIRLAPTCIPHIVRADSVYHVKV